MRIDRSTISWLLKSEIPTIRFQTLTLLEERAMDDPKVVETRRAVMEQGPVPAILARQTERGDWTGEHSYYTPKYTSTHWAMLMLDELGADGSDPRIIRGANFMLDASLPWDKKNRALPARIELECLYGNILRYTGRCGLANDPRAQQMTEYLAKCALEGGWRCPHNWGEPCAWGAARALWGFSAVPASTRSPDVQSAIEAGLELLLEDSRLVDGCYPVGEGKVHSLWQTLNFPLFYQADILFVLRVLAEFDQLAHPGAQPALEWLASRPVDGRFHASSPFRTRTYRAMGKPEETYRWVTLQALYVLGSQPEKGHSMGA